MKKNYSIMYNRVISLIKSHHYKEFDGPLTDFNFKELIESLPKDKLNDNDENIKYDLLNKKDMETRINYLETMQKRSDKYIINNNNEQYLFILFHWNAPYNVIISLYAGLTDLEKTEFANILLHNGIFFDHLSHDLIVVGFYPNGDYQLND